MESELRISGVEPESIVDGPGFRYTVFTQGCPHRCPGCHNPQTHPFEGGRLVAVEALFGEICENPLLRGVTFSGGEPFSQPGPLAELAKLAHTRGLDVAVFTGWAYEQLLAMNDPDAAALLAQTDLLIDGPYLEGQRDLELLFRGSKNQRLIDLNKTRASGKLTLWEP